MQLIDYFRESGYGITFASTANTTEFSADLEKTGVRIQQLTLNDAGFDGWIRELTPDVVLFDRYITEEHFGWRVARIQPSALRILDTEDLHSLRSSREEAFLAGREFTLFQWLQHETTLRELASIYRSDCSLIISEYERRVLLEEVHMPQSLLLHLPFMLDSVKPGALRPFDGREGFVCIGNGRHRPNLHAMQWLKSGIWPLIRKKLPQVRVALYGAYLPEAIRRLHEPACGFHVMGWTPDSGAVLEKARVQLAPLQFGAGIKGKLAESMSTGTPSVTTGIGAEGMHGEFAWNGAIADNASDFAAAAVSLYSDKALWDEARQRGVALINKRYSKQVHHANLDHAISRLREQLQAHRAKNIIGAMLRHHSMASTKYLSKWIEAKRNPAR